MKVLGVCCGASTISMVEIVIEARLETFVLQSKRLHEIMTAPDTVPLKGKNETPAVSPRTLPFNQPERVLATS